MKQYAVLDPTLVQVSQGDSIFPVNDGMITMPAEIARDLVESGQLVLASNLVVKAEPNTTPATTNGGSDEDAGKSGDDGSAGDSGNSGDDEGAKDVEGEQA